MKKLILLLTIVLSTALVKATDTPFDHGFRQLSGGLNTTSSPIYLPDTQSPYMINMDQDGTYGALTSRKGSLTCGTYPTGNPIITMHQYTKSQTQVYLVASDGTSIYATQDCTSWTPIATGLPSDRYNFSTVRGKLWAVSQSTSAIVWDSLNTTYLDSASTYSNPPHAKNILYWQSRVWLSNTAVGPSTLYYSVLVDTSGVQLDPTLAGSFSALYQLYINPEDGGQISGIIPYAGYLFVFKDTGIWRIQFQDEYNLTVSQNISNVGCISGASIKEFNGVLYFLAKDGLIYTFNGATVQPAGLQVKSITQQANQNAGGLRSVYYSNDTDYALGTLDNLATGDNALEVYSSLNSITNTATGVVSHEFGNMTTPNGTNTPNAYGGYMYVGSTNTVKGYGNFGMRLLFPIAYPNEPATPDLVMTTTQNFVLNANSTNLTPGSFTGYGITCIQSQHVNSSKYSIIDQSCKLASYDLTSPYIHYISTDIFSAEYLHQFTYGGDLITLPGIYELNFFVSVKPDKTVNIQAWDSPSHLNTVISSNTNNLSAYIPSVNSNGYFGYFSTNTIVCSDYSNYTFVGIMSHATNYYQLEAPIPVASGSWTSPAILANNLSAWNSFYATYHSLYNTEASSLTFYQRTAPTISELSSQPWTVMTEGALTLPKNAAAQIKVDIIDTFISSDTRLYINNLSLLWLYGSNALFTPTGFIYNNKYWLSIATGSEVNNSILLKFSLVPSAHYSLYDLKCSTLLLFGETPMCANSGISKLTSWDIGNTDDGLPINFEWQSGDQLENAPYYPKYIQYMLLDYLSTSGSNFTYGYSIDQGVTWKDFLETSSGRNRREIHRYNTTSQQANQYRVHIKGSTYNTITLYGINALGFVRNTMAQ